MTRLNDDTSAPERTDWRSLTLLFAGNVLFAAGLIVHAFLFNFYLRELKLSPAAMGHQVAAMTLGGLCALLPAGVIIDRIGARAALLGGVSATFVGLVLTALARATAPIYGAAFVTGVGAAACRVAWGPAIMRLTSAASRARAFTWNVALLIATGSAWTLLAGALSTSSARFAIDTGLSATQLVLLASAVVTGGASLCYGRLRLPASGGVQRETRWTLPAEVRALIPLIALWMLAAALVLPFFNIFFADRFSMSVPRIGALFAIAQVATAGVLVGAAELARRWGPQRMLLVWMVLLPTALLWLSATSLLWVAAALYVVQGIVGPATNPLIDQLLLERTRRDRQGVVAGWRNAAAEGAGAVGASAGGPLLDASTFSALFVVAGVIAAASAALLSSELRTPRPSAVLTDAEAA